MSILDELWEDQQAFNRTLRQPPENEQQRMEQTREIVLHLESELHELLDTYSWKFHRRNPHVENRAQRAEEIVDVFKFFLTLAQIQGLTLDEFIKTYWRKTAVVRQRYAQEWVHRVDRPYVVVDIDGVLCDYARGFSDWIIQHHPDAIDRERCERTLAEGRWMDATSVGMSEDMWRRLQFEFRVDGGKRTLPSFPDAADFLLRCRNHGYLIILLTSRPVDEYPFIYTDTIYWLMQQNFAFDIVWWARNKGDHLRFRELPRDLFAFYVDDDIRYVEQVSKIGYLPAYWLHRLPLPPEGAIDVKLALPPFGVIPIQSLDEIRLLHV